MVRCSVMCGHSVALSKAYTLKVLLYGLQGRVCIPQVRLDATVILLSGKVSGFCLPLVFVMC